MATRVVPAPLAHVPNALTVLRLALIPVFVVLLLAADGERSIAAALVFALAGITDQVDGWLARRWRVESPFGKFADPLADRLMIDAAVVLLWLEGRLPWLALAVILARDGLSKHAIYVAHATRPDERVVPMSELADDEAPYFSMILISKAAS